MKFISWTATYIGGEGRMENWTRCVTLNIVIMRVGILLCLRLRTAADSDSSTSLFFLTSPSMKPGREYLHGRKVPSLSSRVSIFLSSWYWRLRFERCIVHSHITILTFHWTDSRPLLPIPNGEKKHWPSYFMTTCHTDSVCYFYCSFF